MKKDVYPVFEENTKRLCEFIKIFKNDLVNIGIKRKEEEDCYVCSLVMNYSDYSIDSEFESTGIKKLVKLFDYLDKMVNGGIVFIDELDSNLHDVYLCALLEYLAENAEGQICFTTHNIGPMDILRKNRKSIDFLSCDHKVISWTKSGNYSPASLYRNGMIEGSAFNVFPFDFVKAFYSAGKDK
jgi:AAA15 family ATPase/GTPase